MAYNPITFVAFDPLTAAELNQMGDNDEYFNDVVEDGWVEVSDAWSYASATTITVPTDATTKYQVGDRIKITQTTPKYFYVVAVAATVLTVSGGTDYTVANAAITAPFYSHVQSPLGFPAYFAMANNQRLHMDGKQMTITGYQTHVATGAAVYKSDTVTFGVAFITDPPIVIVGSHAGRGAPPTPATAYTENVFATASTIGLTTFIATVQRGEGGEGAQNLQNATYISEFVAIGRR